MAEAAFDTIAEVRKLRDVGFRQDQAEAITRSIHAGVTGGVTTKADLRMAETSLRSDMERLETGLRSDMERLETGLRSDMERLETGLRGELERLETGLRGELERLGGDLRTEVAKVEGNLRTEIESTRTLIAAGQTTHLRWMVGLIFALVVALVGVLGAALFL